MKKTAILLIIIILLVLSNLFFILNPVKVKEKEVVESLRYELPKEESDELARKAINEGDNKAYRRFSEDYTLNYKKYELFYYSFIMANKHNSPDAFFDLYIILTRKTSLNGVRMYSSDEITQNYAKYFLLKSYELGKERAKNQFDDIFGEEEELHHSSYYLNKIAGDTLSTPIK